MKFIFMVDVKKHLNQLNIKLKGRRNPEFSLFKEVLLREKLFIFANETKSENLLHFPNLSLYQNEINLVTEKKFSKKPF